MGDADIMKKKIEMLEAKLSKVEGDMKASTRALIVEYYTAKLKAMEEEIKEAEIVQKELREFKPVKPEEAEKSLAAAKEKSDAAAKELEEPEKKLAELKDPKDAKEKEKLAKKIEELKKAKAECDSAEQAARTGLENAKKFADTSLEDVESRVAMLLRERDSIGRMLGISARSPGAPQGKSEKFIIGGKTCTFCGAYYAGDTCPDCGAKVLSVGTIDDGKEAAPVVRSRQEEPFISKYGIIFVILGIVMTIMGYFLLMS